MDRITEITESTLNALAPLCHARVEQVGMPDVLHQQLSTCVDQAYRGARQAGFADADADDIRFALAALVDETVLTKGGTLSAFWLPRSLQLRLYKENLGGKVFYERLEKLRGDPARAEVLVVYYLCLLFGFRGQHRVRGGEVEVTDLLVQLRKELTSAGLADLDAEVAPHGARPYEPAADIQRNLLVLWIAACAAGAASLFYLTLKLSLMAAKTEVVDQVRAAIGW